MEITFLHRLTRYGVGCTNTFETQIKHTGSEFNDTL